MNLDELAKRLVKCKHFRWTVGMKCDYYVDRHGGFIHSQRCLWKGLPVMEHLDHWPDLADPATLGCLLHLVREAWGDPGLSTGRNPPYYGDKVWRMVPTAWTGDCMTQMCSMHFATEAEALVAALEAS